MPESPPGRTSDGSKNRLATLGILRENTGYRRNRLFRCESYIQLLSETPAEPVPPPPAPASSSPSAFAAKRASPPPPASLQI